MVDLRARILACTLFLAGLLSTSCHAPVAFAEVLPVGFDELVRALPEGGERTELLIDGQTVLRGVYVPPAPGGAVVLHLLESGGSIARGLGGRLGLLRELADLGLGSLMLDWSGVGVSAGVRDNKNLRRDASFMWREALRRVDGDETRILVRSASLGTLAAAGLLERGAKPGAVIMIAPVLAKTAPRNFAMQRYGAFWGGMLTAGMQPIIDIDLRSAVKTANCPLLILQPNQGDVFVTPEEELELRSSTHAVTTRFGKVMGGHVEAVLRSHSLFDQELAFLGRWTPSMADADARATLLQTQMPGGTIPSLMREEEVQRRLVDIIPFTRTQPSERIVASGMASERIHNGLRLLWLLEDSWGALPETYEGLDPGELVDALSLQDPAGEVPIDLIASLRVPYAILEVMGGTSVRFKATSLPNMAWSGGDGLAGGSWASRMEIAWMGTESFEFDHARIWRSLLERGLSPADARRQLVRILLFAYGYAHRLRQASAGGWVLEYWEEGNWIPLDLDTPPKSFDLPAMGMAGHV